MIDSNKKNNQNHDKQINVELQQRLQQLLMDLQLEDGPAGGAVVVYQAGKCIAEASIGMARAEMSWQPDTLAINFSTGKGILATLIHVLVSQQMLNYDVPIANYWPAFAAGDKETITLRSVMSHQANLFSIQSIDVDNEIILDWHTMLNKVAAMPMTPPDNAEAYDSAYSALIYGWILGGLVEVVTDMSLAEALSHYLTTPLGIADSCYFGVPDSKIAKVATLARDFGVSSDDNPAPLTLRNKRHKPTLKVDSQHILNTYANLPSHSCWQQHTLENQAAAHHNHKSDKIKLSADDKPPMLDTMRINGLYFDKSHLNLKNYKAALIPDNKNTLDYHNRATLQAVIPAANGVASAQALATIYAMLANGGTWKGQTLIDNETVQQLSVSPVTGLDAVMPAKMYWRLGYHRMFHLCSDEKANTMDSEWSSFGHMGYNGSVAWCDPKRQLSFAFIHNFDTTMLHDIRQFALTETVLSLIDDI
ncbi:serine hydrolase domain-containing protein [Psychrobacter vallis]|uniref:serine hydrolase domain-containing protein n=1 Tax=Psychrobacter vallis TaxID=248451 RepID=UPI0019195E04|nr:serine hydrolase domain-containing protein [Psychrobacter vallis]